MSTPPNLAELTNAIRKVVEYSWHPELADYEVQQDLGNDSGVRSHILHDLAILATAVGLPLAIPKEN